MDIFTTEALMELSLKLLFYFIVGTLGAFTKDLYETMTKKMEKIRLGEVLVGGIVAAIICYGLSDTWFKDFSLNTMFLITFVFGVLGFEIFGNITSITKIRNFLVIVDEIRKGIPPSESQSNINLDDKKETSQVSKDSAEVNTDKVNENNKKDSNEDIV